MSEGEEVVSTANVADERDEPFRAEEHSSLPLATVVLAPSVGADSAAAALAELGGVDAVRAALVAGRPLVLQARPVDAGGVPLLSVRRPTKFALVLRIRRRRLAAASATTKSTIHGEEEDDDDDDEDDDEEEKDGKEEDEEDEEEKEGNGDAEETVSHEVEVVAAVDAVVAFDRPFDFQLLPPQRGAAGDPRRQTRFVSEAELFDPELDEPLMPVPIRCLRETHLSKEHMEIYANPKDNPYLKMRPLMKRVRDDS
jgi:hypothetical protein